MYVTVAVVAVSAVAGATTAVLLESSVPKATAPAGTVVSPFAPAGSESPDVQPVTPPAPGAWSVDRGVQVGPRG